jgi:hypothetical protein
MNVRNYIAGDVKAVRRLLSLNQEVFLEQLERVASKAGTGLRVKWDVPNIFEFFLDIHPELRAACSDCWPRPQDRRTTGQDRDADACRRGFRSNRFPRADNRQAEDERRANVI